MTWVYSVDNFPPGRGYRIVETWELPNSRPVDSESGENLTVVIKDDRALQVFFHQDIYEFLKVKADGRKLRYYSSTEPCEGNHVVSERPSFDPWIRYSREISELPLRVRKKMVASWNYHDRRRAEDAYFKIPKGHPKTRGKLWAEICDRV